MLLQSAISVTRFCKIPPLWQIFKIFGNLFKVYLVLGKVSNLLWHNLCAIGQIFITENGQKLKTQFGNLVTLVGKHMRDISAKSK